MYKYIFGPVPSRRLGISLGIDLLKEKICTLNCIYCECGKTNVLTTTRNEFVPLVEVMEEIKEYFSEYDKPDYVTFSGSGEPTLHTGIGKVIDHLKDTYDVPVAVLTNGTLLSVPQVRKELLRSDLVIPSLDAALDLSFKRINRPHKSIKIDDYIQGLIDFRKEYIGEIWLEVFIIPDINDSEEDLIALKEAILKIKPNRVQLNSMDRPGAVAGLPKATNQELMNIINFWGLEIVEIIAKFTKREQIKSYNTNKEEAILETISRRPCTLEDLEHLTGLHKNEVNKYLDVLEAAGKIVPESLDRGVFYNSPRTEFNGPTF
jgi:wyosine [tRNA(Phe)-imidazoG37] synthetase (radical SAM superfamily)